MTRKQTSVITALTLIAIALGFMVSRQFWFRLDVTRDGLNTISPVSRNLHEEIRDRVHITYFVSDALRARDPMPGKIEDFLREYVSFSRGRMRLTTHDPIRADMVREIEALGILPRQIPIVDRGQASILTVYTGIVIEYLDDVSVLPLVFSLDTLEYDLTSRIRSMVRGAPRVVGIILGGAPANPRLWDENFRHLHAVFMQSGYQVRFINPGDEIPDALSALMVIDGVETLDEIALYRIDRYIRGGGRAFFAARAVGVDVHGGMIARTLNDRGLLAMLASYGVIVHPEIVMDRAALLMRYQAPAPGGGQQIRTALNFQWIRALPEYGNPLHPVSASFGGLDLYWANPLTLAPPEGVFAEPLFSTTGDAWTMRAPFFIGPEFADMVERDAGETAIGGRILGASLSGVFPSWFEGRSSPVALGADALPSAPVDPRPARVIVVGETDFLSSFMVVTDALHNLGFAVQAADWLGHEDDIIGIRARTAGSGRLDRIGDPESMLAAMRFSRTLNVFVIPILVILAGAFAAFKRRAMTKARRGGEEE